MLLLPQLRMFAFRCFCTGEQIFSYFSCLVIYFFLKIVSTILSILSRSFRFFRSKLDQLGLKMDSTGSGSKDDVAVVVKLERVPKRPRVLKDSDDATVIPEAKRPRVARKCPETVNGYKVYEVSEVLALVKSREYRHAIHLWQLAELNAHDGSNKSDVTWASYSDAQLKIMFEKKIWPASPWPGSLAVHVRPPRCQKPILVSLTKCMRRGVYCTDDYEYTCASVPLRYLNFQAGQSLLYCARGHLRFENGSQPWNETRKDRQCVTVLMCLTHPSADSSLSTVLMASPIFDRRLLSDVFQFLS